MSKEFVTLEPKYMLDENWKRLRPVPDAKPRMYMPLPRDRWRGRMPLPRDRWRGRMPLPRDRWGEREKEWVKWVRSIRIEIMEAAETRVIASKRKYDYLESEIGMNIVVPKGDIKEMRFHVSLIADLKILAIDGFPRDVIEKKHIVGGRIKVAINKFFKFIPVFGKALAEPIELELGPWEFKLGSLKKVNVDFSGGLTSSPEWYFKKDGIKNDLRVALTIKKPRNIKQIKGEITSGWLYDPGFLKKVRLGTDSKTIKIY